MKKTGKNPTAEEIAAMAERGEGRFPLFHQPGADEAADPAGKRDFTVEMLAELDAVARELNISRQAVIKSFLRQALDQHYLARSRAV